MSEGCITGSMGEYRWLAFRYRQVIARQVHRCGECGGVINIGDEFQIIDGQDQDTFKLTVFKTCRICKRIREDMYCVGTEEYGDLRGAIRDNFGYDYVTNKHKLKEQSGEEELPF